MVGLPAIMEAEVLCPNWANPRGREVGFSGFRGVGSIPKDVPSWGLSFPFVRPPHRDEKGLKVMTTKQPKRPTGLRELQHRVEGAMRAGASVDRVDAEIIRPSQLDDERQAAAWLYARSLASERAEYAARQAMTVRHAREAPTPVGTD